MNFICNSVLLATLLIGPMAQAVQFTENFGDLAQTDKSVFVLQKGVSKGSVLIAHGLNLRPSRMNALANFFYQSGYDVYRVALAGHDGDMQAFKSATGDQWVSEMVDAEHVMRAQLSKTAVAGAPPRPVILLGYSLGAVSGIAAFNKGLVSFDKMILLAPPLKVTFLSSLVKNFFGYPNLSLPSRNSPNYNAHPQCPISAYIALFDIIDSIQGELSPALSQTKALVFFNLRDELVDTVKSMKYVSDHQLPWEIQTISKENSTLRPVIQHVMIDEASLGRRPFSEMLDKISAFIAAQ